MKEEEEGKGRGAREREERECEKWTVEARREQKVGYGLRLTLRVEGRTLK